MHALVTGGAGFIGLHLVRRLVADGHQVTVLFYSPTPTPVKLFPPGVQLYPANVAYSSLSYPRCFSDWIFHLAALTDIVASISRPEEYFRTNVLGTLNMLSYALALGVKRFVYASSTSIYGIPAELPTPETATPKPLYPYSLTKWLAEELVMHWGQVYKLPVVALRPTTVYGPGMGAWAKGYGSVIKVFMAQKAHGLPYTVVGDGSQSRDFVYVEDVVEAFVQAAQSDVQGEAFNVGSGKPRTVNELLGLLGQENGIVRLPRRPGEPDITWADISKARKLLGWEPKVSLEQGLANMVSNMSEWDGATAWTPEGIAKQTEPWFRYLGRG